MHGRHKIKHEMGILIDYYQNIIYIMSLHFDINFFGCTYEVECIVMCLYVFEIKIHKMVA